METQYNLMIEHKQDTIEVHLNDTSIAKYSPTNFNLEGDLNGEFFDMPQEYGFNGFLWLNKDFFHRFRIPKPMESQSNMRNVAKAFFKIEDTNHVCLVQYLHPNGSSAEHYHTLDEYIVQLAGKSHLELRPIENLNEKTVVEMTPATVLHIKPGMLHIVKTSDNGSLTIPIKQTNPKKKDHLYLNQ
jgi:hypothetical protein